MKLIFLLNVLWMISCTNQTPKDNIVVKAAFLTSDSEELGKVGLDNDYWYSGKAEVSKYELIQNRYREIHEGEIILIFVTEDFLTDIQVKNDKYENKNSVSVLKTNQLRRFTTGLYDYSMMTSVFTRANGNGTEKITLSSQDWCGQSFVQINKKGEKYKVQLRSYFESESDQDKLISAQLLEDEVMNLIRINPDLIPTGNVDVLPSLVYLRLSHGNLEAQRAKITRTKNEKSTSLKITYPDDQRTVSITYENQALHRIISFEEIYPSAFDNKLRTSKATRVSEMHDAYWKMNHATEKEKRVDLGISGF